jgi:hypothetical protein
VEGRTGGGSRGYDIKGATAPTEHVAYGQGQQRSMQHVDTAWTMMHTPFAPQTAEDLLDYRWRSRAGHFAATIGPRPADGDRVSRVRS